LCILAFIVFDEMCVPQVVPGMVMQVGFWADAARGGNPTKFRAGLCPEGHRFIRAFTPVEVTFSIKVNSFAHQSVTFSFWHHHFFARMHAGLVQVRRGKRRP
jgi:hypothetical protein